MKTQLSNTMLYILLIMSALPGYSQDKWIEDVRVSTWYGTRDISCTQYPLTSDMDFMHYLKANSEYAEDDYAGFASLMKFRGNWETDLRFNLNSGWGFSAYNIKVRYFPIKQIGLSAGIFGYPYYINGFDEYHTSRDLEYYTDIRNNSSHKQRVASDFGLQAGVSVPLHFFFLHTTLQVHGGMSSFSRFTESFGQKLINSNLKREIKYETQSSYNWFVLPEAEFYIDLLRIKQARIGIQVQASYYLTNKYINYQRRISEWTFNSPIIEEISGPKHRLEKVEVDFGIFVRW